LLESEAKNAHGGNVWVAAKKWKIHPDKFLDYSANINPLGMSIRGINAIKDNMGMLTHYPEPSGEGFKNSLSKYLHIQPENLVLGNGGSELIYLVGRMYYQNRILLLAPTFSEYGEGIGQPYIKQVNLDPEVGFKLPTKEIIEEMRESDLIFIGNPNNPTGNLFSWKELKQIILAAGDVKAVVVIDEAFIDFAGDEHSCRYLVADHKNLVVLGSLTKFFAMPSLRLGYAVSAAENVKKMEQLLPPWRINTMALAVGEASIKHQEYIDESLVTVKKERDFLSEELRKIKGLKVYSSVSNFILIDALNTGFTANEIQEKIGPKGILIRECNNFGNLSPYYFRAAVKTRSENEKFLSILSRILNCKKS